MRASGPRSRGYRRFCEEHSPALLTVSARPLGRGSPSRGHRTACNAVFVSRIVMSDLV